MKKKKVLITSLAVIFSLSVGTAFASNDVGSKLQQWYEEKFQQSANDIKDEIDELDPEEHTKWEIYPFAKELIKKIQLELEQFVTNNAAENSNNIKEYRDKHLGDLNKKNTELKGYVENDFNEFITEKKGEINNTLEDKVKELLEELNNELNNQTEKSLEEVTLKVGNISITAEGSLRSAIDSSKKNVIAQIEDEERDAVLRVKAHLDTTIIETKENIEEYSITYSSKKIEDIENESIRLQEEAKKDMLNIIFNINN